MELVGGGGRVREGEECSGERGEARLAELYGDDGELGGEDVEEHGGEEEVEEERLLTDRSTGSSCVCGV